MGKKAKIIYSDEELRSAFQDSINLTEICKKLGFKTGGAKTAARVKADLIRLGLDPSTKHNKRFVTISNSAKPDKQAEARELRKLGYSLTEIKNKLKVAKSSVSVWVRNTPLSEQAQDRLASLAGKPIVGRKPATQKRYALFNEEGAKMFEVDSEFEKICYLYWAEGAKDQGYASICNTDPLMLALVTNWLDKNRISWKFTVQYYKENSISEKEIFNYWKTYLLSLNEKQLRKFTARDPFKHRKPETKRKPKNKYPFGIGVIIINNVRLRQQIEGGLLKIKAQIKENIKQVNHDLRLL